MKEQSDLIKALKSEVSKNGVPLSDIPESVFLFAEQEKHRHFKSPIEASIKKYADGICRTYNALSQSDEDFWGDLISEEPLDLLMDSMRWDVRWQYMTYRKNVEVYARDSGFPLDEKTLRLVKMGTSGPDPIYAISRSFFGTDPSDMFKRNDNEKRIELILSLLNRVEKIPMPKDKKTSSALTQSVNFGSLEIVKGILARAPKEMLDFKTVKEGNTPLSRAISRKRFEITQLLLEAGCSPNAPGSQNRLPLESAYRCGWLKGAKLLVSFGAQATLQQNLDAMQEFVESDAGHVKTKAFFARKELNKSSRKILSFILKGDEDDSVFEKVLYSDDFIHPSIAIYESHALSMKAGLSGANTRKSEKGL